ncbi:MAG TPA: efflux RND transporter periplasmic adaptor subunit, partial [Geminicoccaceae bacterium]|nr:efflux RND transporter periplasmic adaptor subunit [Geminicoccaceae bacterium]
MKRLLVGIPAVLLVGAVAAWGYLRDEASADPGLATAEVTRGEIEDTVTALGTLQPLQYVDVGVQVSGQLRKIHVAIGDQVRQGDLLAEIDPRIYQARVQADRATLASLEAQRAERQAQRTLAERQYDRQKGLLQANATSREAFEGAEAALEVAKAQIAALNAQITHAQSTLEGDETNLGYTKIYAPMSGTVVSLEARQGQTLNSSQQTPIVLRLADLDTMTVRTQVSEADVNRLAPGMPVYFNTLGQPERRWSGTLRQVLPTPEVVNNVVLYNALFDVPNPDQVLMSQMTAQVFFVLERTADTLLAPMAALGPVTGHGASTVHVVGPGGRVEQRAVTIGVRNRISAEVLSGLAEGERIV